MTMALHKTTDRVLDGYPDWAVATPRMAQTTIGEPETPPTRQRMARRGIVGKEGKRNGY